MGMWSRIARDNLKSVLPFRDTLRKVKRSLIPYQSDSQNDALAISQGLTIIELARDHGTNLHGAMILEIGTGWIPTIPALFQLMGAEKIIGADKERLLDEATIDLARDVVTKDSDRIRDRLDLPAGLDLAEELRDLKLDYRCPFDPDTIPNGQIDLIYSRAVLEHVKPDELDSLLAGAFRMLRPGGLTIHLVDNSDHFQHRERDLSRVNFLRFGPLVWRLMCLDGQNYQNRMRHSDYRDRFKAAGFEILADLGEPDDQALEDLETLPLAAAFVGRDKADLAVLTSIFVARRPADS